MEGYFVGWSDLTSTSIMDSGRNSVNMADSASESDSGSVDGGPIMMPPSPVTREQLHKRIESLQQQNRVLKVELETYKLRVKQLQEENRSLRQASVNIVTHFDHILVLIE